MAPIVEVVVVVDIVDVKVIVVAPVVGPRIDILEPIPTILKALVSASSTAAALHVEGVFAAEAAPETIIRNATAAAGRLPSGVLAALLCLDTIAIIALRLIALLIPRAFTILPIAILLSTILLSTSAILILPVSLLLLCTIAILIAPVSACPCPCHPGFASRMRRCREAKTGQWLLPTAS